MKAVADGALSSDGEVIGVIPKSLETLELAHPKLTKLFVTQGMHERKGTDGNNWLMGSLPFPEDTAQWKRSWK